jgi:hypothetical protein
MKHNKPFRSVFDGDRYCGALTFSGTMWIAHDSDCRRVGAFSDPDKAAARLRRQPRHVSWQST